MDYGIIVRHVRNIKIRFEKAMIMYNSITIKDIYFYIMIDINI